MSECERCGGRGRFELFSSKEDPCIQCGGSGQIDEDEGDEFEEEDKFLDKLFSMRELSKCNEVIGWEIGGHPVDSQVIDLINEFEEQVVRSASVSSLKSDPLELMKSNPPLIYYRRAPGMSLSFPRGLGSYDVASTYNSVQSEQPCDSLIIVSRLPLLLMAVYYRW